MKFLHDFEFKQFKWHSEANKCKGLVVLIGDNKNPFKEASSDTIRNKSSTSVAAAIL